MRAQSFLYVMIFLYVCLLAYLTLFLGSPSNNLIGTEHLFYERVLPLDSLVPYDSLGFGGQKIPFSPTLYLLNLVSFIPLWVIAWILLILSFILLVIFLHQIKIESKIFSILVLFFSTPIFAISMMSLSHQAFIFVFFLSFLVSALSKSFKWLSYLFAFILGIYGFGPFAILLLFLLSNPLNLKNRFWLLIPTLVGLGCNVYFKYITESKLFITHLVFPIIEFGQVSGLSILIVFLAIISAIMYSSKASLRVYIFGIVSLIISLFFQDVFLFISLLISIIASYSLSVYFDRKWFSLGLHISSLIALLVLFVFSQIFIFQSISAVYSEQPAPIFIPEFIEKTGVIFSSPETGFFIESRGYPSFWNSNSQQINAQEKIELYEQIISNYSTMGVKKLLNENNISYIYVTPQFSEDANEYLSGGILLPLNDNETFTLLSLKGEYELYEVN